MTAPERYRAAEYMVRRAGYSYARAAFLLGTTRGAIAGALAVAEGRRKLKYPVGHFHRALNLPRGPRDTYWTESRLTEKWSSRDHSRS